LRGQTLRICALFSTLLFLAACQSTYIGPKFQSHIADVEFDYPAGDDDVEMDFASIGLELAAEIEVAESVAIEAFADASYAESRDKEAHIDFDGSEAGLGIRAPVPKKEGWGAQYELRASYVALESEDKLLGDHIEMEGPGLDANLGPRYSIRVGDGEFILSNQFGLFLKYREGEQDWRGVDTDYELLSVGGFAGLRIIPFKGRGPELRGTFFLGTESLAGVVVSAGFRF
jgi:hypothetical protein